MPPNKPLLLHPIWDKKRGRLYVTSGSYEYVTSHGIFTIPDKFVTDLASTPRIIWSLLPRDGKYLEAALLHDYLYRTHQVPKEIADIIFLNEMYRMGVSKFKRILIYNAVKLFGGKSYSKYD